MKAKSNPENSKKKRAKGPARQPKDLVITKAEKIKGGRASDLGGSHNNLTH